VGVGEMSELTAQHLQSSGVGELVVTNRTHQNAVNMADRFGGRAVEFERFGECLEQTDIVISATGAPRPIIEAPQVAKAMAVRKQRPLFLIDVAIPRDIDPAVGEVPNVYLFNIDDLKTVAEKNYRGRIEEAQKAEGLVIEEAGRFSRWLKTLKAAPVLERINQLGAGIVSDELRALSFRLSRLDEGDRRAVKSAIQGVVGKILHRPLVNLKRLVQEEESDDLLRLVEELFFGDLEEFETPPVPERLPTPVAEEDIVAGGLPLSGKGSG
jgi:glutamyl-tRNA reductase